MRQVPVIQLIISLNITLAIQHAQAAPIRLMIGQEGHREFWSLIEPSDGSRYPT
jgi:hypothetical protein